MPDQRAEETRSFSQFLLSLEDGDLHAQLSEDLREIAAVMSQHVVDYGGKVKGKLSLTIDFKLDQGVFEIVAKTETKLPKPPRGRSIMWATPGNNFTANNPKQGQLFGPRDVTGDAGPARAI